MSFLLLLLHLQAEPPGGRCCLSPTSMVIDVTGTDNNHAVLCIIRHISEIVIGQSIYLSIYPSIHPSYLLGGSKQQEDLPPAPPLPVWSRASHGSADDGSPGEVVVMVAMMVAF